MEDEDKLAKGTRAAREEEVGEAEEAADSEEQERDVLETAILLNIPLSHKESLRICEADSTNERTASNHSLTGGREDV